MAIAIRGIRISEVDIIKDDKGMEKVSGKYQLISTADKVLASVGFNSYDDVKVELSGDTKVALANLMEGIKKDVQTTLGLTEGEEK